MAIEKVKSLRIKEGKNVGNLQQGKPAGPGKNTNTICGGRGKIRENRLNATWIKEVGGNFVGTGGSHSHRLN